MRRVLIAAAAFYAAFIARSALVIHGAVYSTLFDDAMVSMRYARNLAHGFGLVWNPSGGRVQGFTNLLWTLVMSVVHATGVPPRLAPMVVSIVGACLLLAATAATYRLTRTLIESDAFAGAAAAFTGLGYALVFWTLRGMETGLLAALLVAASAAAISFGRTDRRRDLGIAAVTSALAIWTRLDAAVPVAIVLAYVVWNARDRRSAIAVAAAALIAGAGVPLLFAWRYYGAALPNTYYLKVANIPPGVRWARGVRTLGVFLLRGQGIALVPAAMLLLDRSSFSERVRRDLLFLSVLVASTCVYSIYVGGDAWEWMGYANRYIAPATPEIAILMAAGAYALLRNARHARLSAAAIGMLLAMQAIALRVLLATHRTDHASFIAYDAGPHAAALMIAAGAGLMGLTVAVASQRRSQAGICFALWLLVNGVPLAQWAAGNAFDLGDDQRELRLGLLLNETLASDGSFAVAWAGNAPYFADRSAVDLLGKTDAVIARTQPVGSIFVPGHDKRDLTYSIGRLHPDVACDLPTGLPGSPDEEAYLAGQGYRLLGGACYVRPCTRVDEARLSAGLAALHW